MRYPISISLRKAKYIITFHALYSCSTFLIAQQTELPLFSTIAIKIRFDNITSKVDLTNRFKNFTAASFSVAELISYLQKGEQDNNHLQLKMDNIIFVPLVITQAGNISQWYLCLQRQKINRSLETIPEVQSFMNENNDWFTLIFKLK